MWLVKCRAALRRRVQVHARSQAGYCRCEMTRSWLEPSRLACCGLAWSEILPYSHLQSCLEIKWKTSNLNTCQKIKICGWLTPTYAVRLQILPWRALTGMSFSGRAGIEVDLLPYKQQAVLWQNWYTADAFIKATAWHALRLLFTLLQAPLSDLVISEFNC